MATRKGAVAEPPEAPDDTAAVDAEADQHADEADIDAAIASLAVQFAGNLAETVNHPTRGLHAKIAEVILEVQYIQKTGTAPAAMGGYSFVEAGQIAAKLRIALASRGVTMLPEHIEQVDIRPNLKGTMLIQTIKTTWRLTDAETGESTTIESMGTGGDTGDKFSPKAQTNAMKYALQVGFLLETGDDPEKFDISEPATGPGINISSGAPVEGVRQGGRQAHVTDAQLSAIRTRLGMLQMEPEAFATLIASVLGGKAPEIPEGSIDEQRSTIVSFLKELTFDEAGTVVQALDTIPTP